MIPRSAVWALVSMVTVFLPGCSDGRTAAGDPPESPSRPAQGAAAEPRAGGAGGGRETWMSCSIQGSKLGYMHFREVPFEEDGQPRVRLEYDDRLRLSRFGTETAVENRLVSVESPDGGVYGFESMVKTGPTAMRARGTVDSGRLLIEETTEGGTRERSLELPPNCGGFFADQLSLVREPLQPGETRRLQALVPVALQIAEVTLQAHHREAVRLPSGTKQLLRITVTTKLGSTKLETLVWADDGGTVWKTRDQQLGLEAVLTSREEALAIGVPAEFDLGMDTVVRVARRLDRPHETREVRYRATLTEGEIASLFATGLSQQVRVLDAKTAEVTVRAVRPHDPREVPEGLETPPTEAARRGSPLLQTEDPRVRQLAGEVPGDGGDPWSLACGLEKHVRDKVAEKNYGTAMATAAEVARTLEGDCTEHAMLLAAVCRVRGIPSRVAIGLVYYPAAQGFAYHMWTEVWIRDRWIPLDPTLGRGGIGAAHLKLAHSAMEGMESFAELLPVIQAIGRLEVEVLSVD